jgi:hypothetical protein
MCWPRCAAQPTALIMKESVAGTGRIRRNEIMINASG